jgi:alkanesulfonate monooxygenase SsuD/methylene tetrahydromethanopterin reductase-like flavin-dependent oxidoreductase (luciferase family)
MTALAGEVADGLMTHPTNTAPRYLREVIRPRLVRGAARAGRDGAAASIMVGPLTATGIDREAVAREREGVRQLLTFLYSTPSYWPSLELYGWKERGERLHALTREGRWGDMGGVVDDAMLDTFAPSGTYAEIADVLREWYADLTDWITFPMPDDPARDPDAAKVIRTLQGG